MKRTFFCFSILLLCALSHAKKDGMNILFIAVDDLRPQMNFYGHEQMITPAMDRLAESSMVFKRAYCSVPVCGASRASLMSGVRPTAQRFVNYYARKDKDFPESPSLVEWFKINGYTTLSNGKIYHDWDDDMQGWSETPWMPAHDGIGWQAYITDESKKIIESNRTEENPHQVIGPSTESPDVPDNAYPDGMLAEKVVKDLEELAQKGEPFFLGVGFWKPHLPFNAPKKYWDMYDRESLELASNPFRPENAPDAAMHRFGELRDMYSDTPEEGPISDELARKLIHGYYACVSYTDAQIAKVLDALENTGLAENTIVILWGDHGWHLGEHGLWCKHANFDLAMNSPLLLRVPGIKGGAKSCAIVEFIDIYPTLCELAEIPLPEHLDGKSFASELREPDNFHKEFAYCRYLNGESIISKDYVYTEWINKNGQLYGKMLYDHKIDKEENHNVVDDESYSEIKTMLSEKLGEMRNSID